MSIRDKLKSLAKSTVDLFPALTVAEKEESRLMGSICAQIIRRRKLLGMTQKEFAIKMNVSQSMVSQWENGECNFTISSLAEIFTTLNVHVDLAFKSYDYDSFSSTDQYSTSQKNTKTFYLDADTLGAAA